MKRIPHLLFTLSLFMGLSQYSYSQQSGELYHEIAEMDSLYFSAQNECDLEMYEYYLSEDFEFYHDKSGYIASKDDEMKGMSIFCGQEQRSRQPLRRELVKGSLKVFPMDNFGALEFVDHIFYLQISDGSEKVIGSGKMTALWKLINDEWKLTRVVSYDHQPLAEVELSKETLELYVGDYIFSDRMVNIQREGKLLRVSDIIDGNVVWSKELFPEEENTFYLNYENVVYEFLRDGSHITGVNIYESGNFLETGKRTK